MTDSPESIIGRDAELGAVTRFVSDEGPGPASLVLEGVAGIGKSVIWRRGIETARARGLAVRMCRCSESDSAWAFAGLGDLLENLDETILDDLPEVQRRALSAALLLSDPMGATATDRVVGVAVLGALRALTRTGPLVLAIDDVQWLDPTSERVLTFALRRLADERIRLLVSVRTPNSRGIHELHNNADLGIPGQRLSVGPVSLGVLQQILHTKLDQTLSRPTLTRLHRATGGSPMLSLEMARALQRRGVEPPVGEPLPVVADFRVLVTERLRGLTVGTRDLLLLTSGLAQPTVEAVTAAVGDAQTSTQQMSEAVAAGVLEIDGERLHFTHPLIASIPYADLTRAERRHLHGRLAAVVTDIEERARHSALGLRGPNAEVAQMLDLAARHARARGSIDAAAELAELARTATPVADVEDRLRRTVDVAEYSVLLGDPTGARSVLTDGLEAAEPGPHRVPGLLLQATIASWESGDATVAAWCEQAMQESGGDVLLLARCHATFAETCPTDAASDLEHAETAVALLRSLAAPPPGLLANAMTNVASHSVRLGRGLAVDTLEQADALQQMDTPLPVSDRAGMALGMYLKVVDRFDESRAWLQTMLTSAEDEGDDSSLPLVLGHLAVLECWAGHYDLALGHAMEGRSQAARMGFRAPMPDSAHVLTLAHHGRLEEARSIGSEDLARDEALGFRSALALHRRSLGLVELFAGNGPAAAEHLVSALTISSDEVGIGEPAILRLHGDAVAALIATNRIEQALNLTNALELSADANNHPWSGAIVGRCRGLLALADRNVPLALDTLEQALVDHQRLPMPFEEARTRHLQGVGLRLAGHRTDSRRAFEQALTVFQSLGTPIQVAQTRADLAGLGGRAGTAGQLTPVEQRITTLVSAGRPNKAVAAELFISVRTVEGHLARIYQKLGVRSRTELAAKAAGGFDPRTVL